MINAAVIGASGKTGRKLIVNNILDSKDLNLSGAIDAPNCPFLGKECSNINRPTGMRYKNHFRY